MLTVLILWTSIFTTQTKQTCFPLLKKKQRLLTDNTSLKQKGQNYTREEDIVLCRAFINLSKNTIEGMEKKLKNFWRNVHNLLGELMVKGTKPGDSSIKIWVQRLIMNKFK